MAKPIIITIDDEPQVLNAVERDLRRHYRRDYRIIKAGSGAEALETVRQLKERDESVALFLSDQRMPNMTGTEFLTRAQRFYPDAWKVLLTAYADTEAAIACINTIGLDHYLMKPWDPPDQNLYPVLDDLLSDWLASAPFPMMAFEWQAPCGRPIVIISRTSWRAIAFPTSGSILKKTALPRELVEAEQSEDGRRLPVIFFPDGRCWWIRTT